MPDPLTATAAIAAAAVYVTKTGYEYVIRSKNGDSNGKCNAQAVQSVMQSSMNLQTRLLTEIKDSQQDMRDGIRELITIQRLKGK